jgi:hypothetical protein
MNAIQNFFVMAFSELWGGIRGLRGLERGMFNEKPRQSQYFWLQ